jgi:hypothetical protein
MTERASELGAPEGVGLTFIGYGRVCVFWRSRS